MQGSLSIERMGQLARVSRAGFYRSLQERVPLEESMEVRSAIQQVALEHRRALRERALVQKHQPSVHARSVFFTCGQRPRTQRRMAAWLRSRARRSGRWRLQPSCPSTRQTCETE